MHVDYFCFLIHLSRKQSCIVNLNILNATLEIGLKYGPVNEI